MWQCYKPQGGKICVTNPGVPADTALSWTLFVNQHNIKTVPWQKIIWSGMCCYKFDMQKELCCPGFVPVRLQQFWTDYKKTKWEKFLKFFTPKDHCKIQLLFVYMLFSHLNWVLWGMVLCGWAYWQSSSAYLQLSASYLQVVCRVCLYLLMVLYCLG